MMIGPLTLSAYRTIGGHLGENRGAAIVLASLVR